MSKFSGPNILAVFNSEQRLLEAISDVRAAGMKTYLVYSPVPHHSIEEAMQRRKSPVRVFTLIGALAGFCTGWGLTAYSVFHYPLIVGGKPLFSIPPFGVLAYILTILFGSLATVIGFLLNARLPQLRLVAAYDERLSSDHFGLQLFAQPDRLAEYEKRFRKLGAVGIRRDVP